MATPHEVLDRLKGDVDILVVGVLDDLAFEIIRGYQYKPPSGYHEWMSTTATRRVRRLARTLFSDWAAVRKGSERHGEFDAIRRVVANWLRPQMEQNFGPLPDGVKLVLSGNGANGVDAARSPANRSWLTRSLRQGQRGR
ncbi:hypothetical protein J2W49_005083 [Hydrogenophaga palleronii]|uniref:Uncharacterized protein n=1 Tax=Hydrogenophaga palleronii TaxID=65655 RepID=A0ABU1WUZ6_9BURK|nr:hypothetical protein [Hydrogenophaga palleronii]MDR7153103.1 hypothetical protein [Hydrogenophaga palleronii]